MLSPRLLLAAWFVTASIFPTVIAAETLSDWVRWRGPADQGSSDITGLPTKWNVDSVRWKTPLPGKGCSTPIVWQQRIYVTAPVEGNDALICFDADGNRVWEVQFGQENPGKHRNGSGSNASPATDGDSIFVYFKSGTLAAVDLTGKVRWQTDLVEMYGADDLYWDQGTSPVLTEQSVVMARMHGGASWLAAFDKKSGELQWKVERNYETPQENDHGYSTPLVIEHRGQEALLTWGAEHLTIHNAANGNLMWSCGGFNPQGNKLWPTIAMPVVVGDMAIIAHGRNDRGIPSLHGVRLAGSGDVTDSARVWDRDDIGTFVPTPVAYEGKVYLVGDKGLVSCLDPASGKTIWSQSLPPNRNRFYASPVIAGGTLYAPREDGVVFVADIRNGFQLLAENDMEESIIASPVPSGSQLILRGIETLFCVGAK